MAEEEAFRKTCKIHRQLRQGSILVFLTGKQEIVRMVNRLRRVLNNDRRDARNQIVADVAAVDHDVEEVDGGMSNNIARDMDDDEADGELFQELEERDDFDDAEKEEALLKAPAPVDGEDIDNQLPQKVIVLPLYSLMSTEEQTKVFAPVPEGHRLIVVATNIAETRFVRAFGMLFVSKRAAGSHHSLSFVICIQYYNSRCVLRRRFWSAKVSKLRCGDWCRIF